MTRPTRPSTIRPKSCCLLGFEHPCHGQYDEPIDCCKEANIGCFTTETPSKPLEDEDMGESTTTNTTTTTPSKPLEDGDMGESTTTNTTATTPMEIEEIIHESTTETEQNQREDNEGDADVDIDLSEYNITLDDC